MIVELFDIRDAARLERAIAIRTEVFVGEQGVPPEIEIDGHDTADLAAVHALALPRARASLEEAAGAGRLYVPSPGIAQIGRMAVLRHARGTGVGRLILDELVAAARKRGLIRAHLHAQTHARDFYIKAGFFDDGEPMWDAGILHQPMSLIL